MIPNVITFTLAKKEKYGLIFTTILSTVVGVGGIYLVRVWPFGGGRFPIFALAIFGLLTAVFCVSGLIRLYKEKGVGIYISDEGILDASTGNTYGTVLWSDVNEIVILDDISDLKRKYIVVRVNNPTDYIQREMIKSKRRTLELKLQFYGSPICFSHRALNCTFEELKEAVFLKYNQYRSSAQAEAQNT